MTFHWTPEAVEKLKAEWPFKSALQLAIELGATSRNAVIAKVHRLNLKKGPAREKTAALRRRRDRARAEQWFPKAERQARARERSEADRMRAEGAFFPVPADAIGTADLVETSCRWPYGDTGDVFDFRYCGHTIARNRYCAAHAALAYTR